jgi:SNF2 family DNA or RNA helicase
MLNFRRLKQDFSPAILKEGKGLYEDEGVLSAKIVSLDVGALRLAASIKGQFENNYEAEIEVDRRESELIDSNCDCPYRFDCVHLAALIFYLEEHLDKILVEYSKEDEAEDEEIEETLRSAEEKVTVQKEEEHRADVLTEYGFASRALSENPFFLPEEASALDRAEVAIIFNDELGGKGEVALHLSLRLPLRSKPLYVPNLREFIDAVRCREPLIIGGKRYHFTLESFGEVGGALLETLLDSLRYAKGDDERSKRMGAVSKERFGELLAKAHRHSHEGAFMPGLCVGGLEKPLKASASRAHLRFQLEYLESPAPKLFLQPKVMVGEEVRPLEELVLFEAVEPGLIHDDTYYRFPDQVKRSHLRHLPQLGEMIVPEPLFGTFVENSLPELQRFAEVTEQKELGAFATLPFVGDLKGRCHLSYLDGELEAALYFQYDDIEVPAASSKLTYEGATAFSSEEGTLARSLVEERAILDDLFQGFVFNDAEGVWVAKSEKKIVEFMTEVVPRNQGRVNFECPENLLDQFVYDETAFELKFTESDQVDRYQVQLKVNGHLKGTSLDRLWENISSKKTFIELERRTGAKRGKKGSGKAAKILVLDLERLTPLVQLFDDIGLTEIDDHTSERPLWSLASLQPSVFKDLPIKLTVSKALKEMQAQMRGDQEIESTTIPVEIDATLRGYQEEGVHWLSRLRQMHLAGILADDMGLGKTLQAIIALVQHKKLEPTDRSLVVCPTSLLYNWHAELSRFAPHLSKLVVDGTPAQRKKLLAKSDGHDVLITSYSLLQKDIETYEEITFGYGILDEAQHIKNRGTRNAKSVKQIRAKHRLILTGTPIENCLDELWSLFDFLMPGLLSSYDRFVEKYIRHSAHTMGKSLEQLSRKVAPFILRRMKSDVLKDLPPVSEITYHCHLSDLQKELYESYAASAREELTKLVKSEGFEKVQIHVLATLTRLKQICCHPAIFAKDKAEEGDSAKYDMLQELIHNLIEGGHKAVIFSQYTRMLGILREDLEKEGIRFSYLDGSSKNRMEIVNEFNDDSSIPLFLVSLKAGGVGINLTEADTVIHYDMWWNPAVQSQATDRVHRLGQERPVSVYTLVTLGTIEEKIRELQNRKKELVRQVVGCDDEAVSKLTWEEVLELLQV